MPDFADSGLTKIAQGWLPYLSSCSRSGEPDGPDLNEGEKVRVRCTLDGMSAIFVEYNSIADRDKARARTLGQNVDARSLTPGVGPAAEGKATPPGRTTGNYVEYAYKSDRGQWHPGSSAGSGGTMRKRPWPAICSRSGRKGSARAGSRCAISGPGTPELPGRILSWA